MVCLFIIFCLISFYFIVCFSFPEKETFGELNLGSNFFEGDIRLTNKQRYMLETIWQDGKPQKKDLMKGFRELWFNNTVPYIIAKGLRKYCKKGNGDSENDDFDIQNNL